MMRLTHIKQTVAWKYKLRGFQKHETVHSTCLHIESSGNKHIHYIYSSNQKCKKVSTFFSIKAATQYHPLANPTIFKLPKETDF